MKKQPDRKKKRKVAPQPGYIPFKERLDKIEGKLDELLERSGLRCGPLPAPEEGPNDHRLAIGWTPTKGLRVVPSGIGTTLGVNGWNIPDGEVRTIEALTTEYHIRVSGSPHEWFQSNFRPATSEEIASYEREQQRLKEDEGLVFGARVKTCDGEGIIQFKDKDIKEWRVFFEDGSMDFYARSGITLLPNS